MRFLPILHGSASTPASYGFRNGEIGSSIPDRSLLRPSGIDPRRYLESTISRTSRRGFFNIIDLSSLWSIPSRDSGYQQEKGIAAYREAERFQTLCEESASRVIDIYV
ncbi:MAG: hypothetical protein FJ106_08525 [Deltaproteobacteria bacterium]|nr:hypothetical protein [Deltaproteobacteria bacterium]